MSLDDDRKTTGEKLQAIHDAVEHVEDVVEEVKAAAKKVAKAAAAQPATPTPAAGVTPAPDTNLYALKLAILEHSQKCQAPEGPLGLLTKEVHNLVDTINQWRGARRMNAVWVSAVVSVVGLGLGAFAKYEFDRLRDMQLELSRKISSHAEIQAPISPPQRFARVVTPGESILPVQGAVP